MGPPLLPAVVHPARVGLGVRLVAGRETGLPKVTERSQRRRSTVFSSPLRAPQRAVLNARSRIPGAGE